MSDKSTSELVIEHLQPFDLKSEGPGKYRCNRPWAPGSDSMGLALTVTDPEHGTWFDHVGGEGGSLYELAEKLKIEIHRNGNGRQPTETKRAYTGLDDYARAHGVGVEVFKAAGWSEMETYQNRPALRFKTKTGLRWRFLDGEKPTFKSEWEYKACWYGLDRAFDMALENTGILVLCNGEPSVVAAQHYGVSACAMTGGEHTEIPAGLLQELREKWGGDIILAPDCDRAGANWAAGLGAQLREAGYTVRAVDLGGGKGFDLADFCNLNQRGSLDRLIDIETPPEASSSDSAPRIQLRDMAYAMQPLPPRAWRIVDLLGPGEVGMLSAYTGSGKTWIGHELAVCHALGVSCMGFETVQGPALIVNEEMGEYDMRLRLSMINRARFGDESTPVKYVSMARFNLFSERTADGDAKLLEACILEVGAQFVLIDALADIMVGGDENAVKDTQPVMMRLSRIAKSTGCAILVLHHVGKSGATRGSTAIPGAVDLAILATREEDSPFMNFKTEKARVISSTRWACKLIWTPDQFYTERYDGASSEKLTNGEAWVIKYLTANGPSPVSAIITQPDDCSERSAKDGLYRLSRSGRIQRTNPDEKGRGTEAIYGLITSAE